MEVRPSSASAPPRPPTLRVEYFCPRVWARAHGIEGIAESKAMSQWLRVTGVPVCPAFTHLIK